MNRFNLECLSFNVKEIYLELEQDLNTKLGRNNLDPENKYKEEIETCLNFRDIGSRIQTSFYKIKNNDYKNIIMCNEEHNKIVVALKEIKDEKILKKIVRGVPQENWNLIEV